MEKNIILAGVGGQGILSIAFVIDNAALDAGFEFKQAEVHGMAQRGGAVQSNLRYADHEIYSDLIPKGAADMVLSVEPLEVMRYWHFLRPDGWVVSSVTPYINIPDYPETAQVLDQLATFPNCILVDGGLIAKAAGNLRAQNMVAVGAASSKLDFTEEQLLEVRRSALQTQGREDRRGQPARLPIRTRRGSLLPRAGGCRDDDPVGPSAVSEDLAGDAMTPPSLRAGPRAWVATRAGSRRCWPPTKTSPATRFRRRPELTADATGPTIGTCLTTRRSHGTHRFSAHRAALSRRRLRWPQPALRARVLSAAAGDRRRGRAGLAAGPDRSEADPGGPRRDPRRPCRAQDRLARHHPQDRGDRCSDRRQDPDRCRERFRRHGAGDPEGLRRIPEPAG